MKMKLKSFACIVTILMIQKIRNKNDWKNGIIFHVWNQLLQKNCECLKDILFLGCGCLNFVQCYLKISQKRYLRRF